MIAWAVVIAVVVFIESGLLFPFLPGDSLLVTAGLTRSSVRHTRGLSAGT